MKTRFFNARIVPFSDDSAKVIEGEVWVEDGKITLVGKPKTEPVAWDEQFDCRGNLLIPGFKNAHTHSAMTFLRSFADDKPLQNWLSEDVFPMEAYLTQDDVYYLTTLAIMEYVSGGITCGFDMYFCNDAIAQSSIDCGFRMMLCGAANDYGGTAEQMSEEYKIFNALNPLIGYRLGFHGEYTTSEGLLLDIAALARQLKAPVYTHNSETLAEVEGCCKRHGLSPTAYLDSLGMLDFGGGGFHCVHFDEHDDEIFKNRGLYVVGNCGSNVKLSSGIAPLERYYSKGIPVALGTDGAASNNCLDFFREMFLATGLQKLKHGAASTDANLVLHSACCVGARALGLNDCDSLQAGKAADMVLIDLHQPNMQPINAITKNLVYSGSKQNVLMTVINGRVVYKNGQWPTVGDPERIFDRCNGIIARIKRQAAR